MCVNREHIHLCEYRISVFDPFSCGHSALCVTLRSLVSPSCWSLRALQAARSLEGFPRSWHITVVIVTTRTHIHIHSQQPLIIFRQLIIGQWAISLLSNICERSRAEIFGHCAVDYLSIFINEFGLLVFMNE